MERKFRKDKLNSRNQMKETQVIYSNRDERGREDENLYSEAETISIADQKEKQCSNKKRKKYQVYKFNNNSMFTLYSESKAKLKENKTKLIVNKQSSLPHLVKIFHKNERIRKSDIISNNRSQVCSDFIVDIIPEWKTSGCMTSFRSPIVQTTWNTYRCQVSKKEEKEESCYCSCCNSDAMFEAMKSLYDCYKKKNCKKCKCILCGHLPLDEKRPSKTKKSSVKVGGCGEKTSKKRQVTKKSSVKVGGCAEKTSEKTEVMKKSFGNVRGCGEKTSERTQVMKKSSDNDGGCGEKTSKKTKVMKKSSDNDGVCCEKSSGKAQACLLRPLEGKTLEQKEIILKELAMHCIPLPDCKTESEEELIDKVCTDLGLPPVPKTEAEREKYKKAIIAGKICPLEGKSAKKKKKILKTEAEMGLPLPEGRTPSEKALICKVKSSVCPPSEGVAMCDKKISTKRECPPKNKKVKSRGTECGSPPSCPQETKKLDKKIATAMKKGKCSNKDACICVLLTHGSGRGVSKVNSRPRTSLKKAPSVSGMNSEKSRKVKTTSVLTTLEDKKYAQKKIIRGTNATCLNMTEGRMQSKKELIRKLKAVTGYLTLEENTPSENERIKRERKETHRHPQLQGSQKEKLLRNIARQGLPLPEGKTPSQKSLIHKIRSETMSLERVLISKKLKAAIAADRFTPIARKTSNQRENILKGLVKSGMPLPEGKTLSQKIILHKVRRDMGLPPEPRTPSLKALRAHAAYIVTPLEAKKEAILKKLYQAGLELPEPKTPSEIAIIERVTSSSRPIRNCCKGATDKIRAPKEGGFATPIEHKSPEQKEKILRGLIKDGLPLPEAKTTSEKNLFQKVRNEMGLPSEFKTPYMKYLYRKARTTGIITPLERKSITQKAVILRKHYNTGLELPDRRTPSEKSIIKIKKTNVSSCLRIKSSKCNALEPQLAPEKQKRLNEKRTKNVQESKRPQEFVCGLLTSEPERRTASTASHTIGDCVGRTSAKSVSVRARPPAVANEKTQEVNKMSTCDRGCGCAKKKIKFKNSYVKITLMAPDISSLCPDECTSRVKGGMIKENGGIKITIGSAIGVPSFSAKKSRRLVPNSCYFNNNNSSTSRDLDGIDTFVKLPPRFNSEILNLKLLQELHAGSNHEENDSKRHLGNIDNNYSVCDRNSDNYIKVTPKNSECYYSTTYDSSLDSFKTSLTLSLCANDESALETSARSSYDSVLIIKTESSLDFSTNSYIGDSLESILSLADSLLSSTSSHYLCYSKTDDSISNQTAEDTDSSTNENDYKVVESTSRSMDKFPSTVNYVLQDKPQKDVLIYRMSEPDIRENKKYSCKTNACENSKPIYVINNLNSDHDVIGMVNQIVSQVLLEDMSSIIVVVPTSDEWDSDISKSYSSTTCVNLSNVFTRWKHVVQRKKTNIVVKPPTYAKSKGFTFKLPPKGPYLIEDTCTRTKETNRSDVELSNNSNTEMKKRNLKQPSFKHDTGKEIYHNLLFGREASSNMQFQSKESSRSLQYRERDVSSNKHFSVARGETVGNELELRRDGREVCCQADLRDKSHTIRECGVSMDTTQDRPCCCSVKAPESPDYYPRYCQHHCVENVVSEIVTPMSLKPTVAQGLTPATYLPMTHMRRSPVIPSQPTPVRICRIPPCSGYKTCHEYKIPACCAHNSYSTAIAKDTFTGGYENINCAPEKLNDTQEKFCKAHEKLYNNNNCENVSENNINTQDIYNNNSKCTLHKLYDAEDKFCDSNNNYHTREKFNDVQEKLNSKNNCGQDKCFDIKKKIVQDKFNCNNKYVQRNFCNAKENTCNAKKKFNDACHCMPDSVIEKVRQIRKARQGFDENMKTCTDDNTNEETSYFMRIPGREPCDCMGGGNYTIELKRQFTEQSVCKLTDKPIDKPYNSPLDQLCAQSNDQPYEQAYDQPIDQPLHQNIDQLIHYPIDQPTDKAIHQPIGPESRQPIQQPTYQPISYPIRQPAAPKLADEEVPPFDWMDEVAMRKIMSELATRTSGFAIKKKKRPRPQAAAEMTLEEALMYLQINNDDSSYKDASNVRSQHHIYYHDQSQDEDVDKCDDECVDEEEDYCACAGLTRTSEKKRGRTGIKGRRAKKSQKEKRKRSVSGSGASENTGSEEREYEMNKKRKKKTIKSKVICECPPMPPPPPPPQQMLVPEPHMPDEEIEEPFNGIKFTIGAKGSASKGLGGVCCFNMVQEEHGILQQDTNKIKSTASAFHVDTLNLGVYSKN